MEVNSNPSTFRIWKENKYGFFIGMIFHYLQIQFFATSINVQSQTHCNANVPHAQAHHLTKLYREGCLKEALHILNITNDHVQNYLTYVCLL